MLLKKEEWKAITKKKKMKNLSIVLYKEQDIIKTRTSTRTRKRIETVEISFNVVLSIVNSFIQ